MKVEVKHTGSGVDWKTVAETLQRVGMAHDKPDVHRRVFAASQATVFIYRNGALIGFGRAISDGIKQAAIYDVAVVPEFQGKGIGTRILKDLMDRLPNCNIILYASPGKEDFYRTLGFRGMKTGMALFQKAAAMANKGFTE